MRANRGRMEGVEVGGRSVSRNWLGAPSPIRMNFLRPFCVAVFMRFDAMVERPLHACQLASQKGKKNPAKNLKRKLCEKKGNAALPLCYGEMSSNPYSMKKDLTEKLAKGTTEFPLFCRIERLFLTS